MEGTASELSSDVLLRKLSVILSNESEIALYSCGGSIPIGLSPGQCNPIAIRWDSPHAGTTKLVLPPQISDRVSVQEQDTVNARGDHEATFAQLTRDCQPATFGYMGRDVLDDTYRKAGKMDTSQFCTTFCPYETGIVDAVAQMLRPRLAEGVGIGSVKAELYKLNVYSGPSGKFHAHVDTPRGETQFGSLVVCLPSLHKGRGLGGQLLVRHGGSDVKYDWSSNNYDLQWAAFYSDCEHEVLEVTSGHRVTLTYNLYDCNTGSGHGNLSCIRPSQLPLHDQVQRIIGEPSFLRYGGTIGFYSAHSYAHTRASTIKCLPRSLKGIDMGVYQTFRSQGLKVDLRPVLNDYKIEDEETGIESFVVGTELHKQSLGDDREWEDNVEACERFFPHTREEHIIWLSRPSHEELAMTFMAYGNQAELSHQYSSMALLIDVPPYSERASMGKGQHSANQMLIQSLLVDR